MKLIEHCEPTFQFICRLKRIALNEKAFNTTLSLATVRKDVDKLFRKLEYSIIHDDDFEGDHEEFTDLLRKFVDTMIVEAGLMISSAWEKEFILEDSSINQDAESAFFASLSKWIERTSVEANDRLLFFHTCLGLGFAQETARSQYGTLLSQLDERIEQITNLKISDQFCPQAYDHLNNENYMERPLPKLMAYSMTLAALLVVVLFIVFNSYTEASAELVDAIDSVISKQDTQ